MRLCVVTAFALAVGLAAPPEAGAQSCRGKDDLVTFLLNSLKFAMTSSDGHVIAERQNSHLPLVPADSVQLVADTTICSRMAAVYAHGLAAASGRPSGRVYVVKVGAVYAVLDPAIVFGEWRYEMIIDAKGTILTRAGL